MWSFLLFVLTATTATLTKAFPIIPIRIYSSYTSSLPPVQIFEPYNIDKNTPCIVFFTGLNGLMPYDVYSTFLTTVACKNISVQIPDAKLKDADFKEWVKQLETKYREVIPMSHSSSSMKIVEQFSKMKTIKKIIFLDPVNTRIFPLQNQKLSLKYVDKILIMNAKKTYEDATIPFIPPVFKITEETLVVGRDCVVRVSEAEEHGHCDLLNQYYSNIIHSSLKMIGSAEDRNGIFEYIVGLSAEIYQFVNETK